MVKEKLKFRKIDLLLSKRRLYEKKECEFVQDVKNQQCSIKAGILMDFSSDKLEKPDRIILLLKKFIENYRYIQ